MSEPIEIEIFGRTYQVRGEKDADYTRELAARVDEQMRAVAERSPLSASPLQISILTLLHLTHELFEARGELTKSEEATEEKAITFIELLESSLGESR